MRCLACNKKFENGEGRYCFRDGHVCVDCKGMIYGIVCTCNDGATNITVGKSYEVENIPMKGIVRIKNDVGKVSRYGIDRFDFGQPKKRCIICEKQIFVANGYMGRCCSDECAEKYETEEGYNDCSADTSEENSPNGW